MTVSTDARRAAKLRALAEYYAMELQGPCRILWPKSAAGVEMLREAWLSIEDEARAGTLPGATELGLGLLNYRDGYRPDCFLWWSEPETDEDREILAAYDREAS